MTNSPKCKVSFCVRFYKICQFFYELVLIFLILSWLFMVVTVGTLYKEAVEISFTIFIKVAYSFYFNIINDEDVCWLFQTLSIFIPYFNHISSMSISYFHLIMYYPIMFLVIEADCYGLFSLRFNSI